MKNNIVISKYMPLTLNMHVDIKSIFDSNVDVQLTNIIDYPKCSIGFHHYIHSLKKDTEILNQFENKKKVYLVTNKFEIDVDNYDNCISKEINKFLNIKDKIPQILSLDFYKIWEILFAFDIIDTDIPLKMCSLNDIGASIQSVLFFREKYAKSNKNDEYNILKTEKIDDNFYNYYNKSHNINKVDKISDKMDLIVSGVNFDYENINIIEQIYFTNLFTNFLYTVKNQKKNGTSIIKMFETFTNISVKFIEMMISIYDKVFIIKPLTSRPSSPERFVIGIGFKYTDKDKEYTNALKKIEDINKLLNDNSKMKLSDIFKSYKLDHTLKVRLIKLNTMISNNLFIAIGENVNFVNGQNYYGDKYQQYRDEQISANTYWVETFLQNSKDFKEMKKKIVENSITTNKINMDDAIRLEKVIE
jgi:23S rRNA U2552 (ribose-2'-O)-methylase RlmE/FtsJ